MLWQEVEAPLCEGLSDLLAKMDIPCFGPVASLARLEGSKLHAKQVMEANNVPTAKFHVLSKDSDIAAALDDFSEIPGSSREMFLLVEKA